MNKKNYWNYRVLATKYKGKLYYGIYEVYYENNKPNGYCDSSLNGYDSVEDLKFTLNKMLIALEKPVLFADKKFPKELKLVNK